MPFTALISLHFKVFDYVSVYTEGASQVAQVVKDLPANAGDVRDIRLISGQGRSPGRGQGNPLWYSCLENSMGRGTWHTTVHGWQRVRHDRPSFSLSLGMWITPLIAGCNLISCHPHSIYHIFSTCSSPSQL